MTRTGSGPVLTLERPRKPGWRLARHLMLAGGLLLGATMGASHAGTTDWSSHDEAMRTRLITGVMDQPVKGLDGQVIAWQADMNSGWKTYWRSPGEAGLPVRVRVNGTPVDLRYPVPRKFTLFGITTYGYGDQVVMPFRLPEGVSGDSLTIEAEFMACKDVCLPFKQQYTLNRDQLGSGDPVADVTLNAWADRLPDVQGGAGAGLAIDGARVVGPKGHQRLIVDASAGQSLDGARLLVECDGIQFAPATVQLRGDGTSARFVVPVMRQGETVHDLNGRDVRLTLVRGDGQAIERDRSLG
ncbi:protein-disulfide reductase DsbD domain-containing protein [Yunchengibacter salinarum]|uniref:protein-disulfide reductase DsbD domain-containing protein n=1 Tax=Yunchengibacter salinarum TaxID=3133399 RepID=UPI0035B5E72B